VAKVVDAFTGQAARKIHATAQEIAMVEVEEVPALDGCQLGAGARDALEHLLRAEAAGKQGRHDSPCAGADVQIEVVDGAIHQQIIDGPEGPDLIDRAEQAAACQDQR
jgi:hypothetical protein